MKTANLIMVVDLWENWTANQRRSVHPSFPPLSKKFALFIDKVLEIEREKGNFIVHNSSFGDGVAKEITICENDFLISSPDKRADIPSLTRVTEDFLVSNLHDKNILIEGARINKIYLIGQAFGHCIHGAYCFIDDVIKRHNINIEISIIVNLSLTVSWSEIQTRGQTKGLPLSWPDESINVQNYNYSLWSPPDTISIDNFKI